MKQHKLFKWSTIIIVSLWLTLFSLVPHLFILISSLLETYASNVHPSFLTIAHYKAVLLDPLYLKVFWRSFKLATTCTCLCFFIAYPFAYGLSSMQHAYKNLLLSLVLVPFWTSSLIRTYAIISILKTKGLLNTILLSLGIIQEPLTLLYTHYAVLVGLVYDLLPFMILPLYASFDKINDHYINAARDLGASRATILIRILIPLTTTGILAGSLLVFLPAMTLFYIPDILGGAKSLFVGNLIQQKFLVGNWSLANALSIILLLLLVLFLCIGRCVQRQPKANA